MEFVIITGMSGAGKSQAIKFFEDIGFYCIDNMPPQLISKVAELFTNADGNYKKVAFATDMRSGEMFSSIIDNLDEFERQNGKCEILFLDAEDEILIKRYKESRRRHPLSEDGNLHTGIKAERELLSGIRQRSTKIVDTSKMSPKQLKDYISGVFSENINPKSAIAVNIMSYGFKYGVPIDADILFDVRFLPNPFYIPSLKEKTGLDKAVYEYVLNYDVTRDFLKKLFDMMLFLLPHYIKEGKSNLVIGIGCTGGKHRSVTIANQLTNFLTDNGYNTYSTHRDINKDRV